MDFIKRRIIITGANGMLGQRLFEFYSTLNDVELLVSSIENDFVFKNQNYIQADISNRNELKKVIYDFCPDFIINAAAYTNVDKSESERETAWKINVKGVEYITETARVLDSHIVHISSDYIFDGKNGPYTENDIPNPLGYYGRTKLASENVLKISGTKNTILRTNVLYGTAKYSRSDFVKWVVESVRAGKEIRIVDDQFNNPTFIDDLVQAINKVIELRKEGIYNIGGSEVLSRYDFTMIIADFFNLDKYLIKKIQTEDLDQPARRPLKSGLITIKAQSELGYKPHSIIQSLELMKRELGL
ncbi:MAG: dTDP-4-dehydrorhamnose reductase [Ignavibacteriales bacterium]|jgi:dTDP-4-dehydrorhamnose reductase|nr:dTDP-4-dehydrorhamnose reductase [Ignavibacteriales bacterium]MDX9713586.1 dTDP-4-dehydrorhamnose reductase [Ignavibacteriaceae bacterium]MEB2354928.1 dTDP-4-dehydrorhamnose reductase [Ignavibacteriales bacterium]HMN16718.1 dTDP-4-dehydrorhamnose reductase [Ignavibacteriaceae bacterium]HOJ06458.1 dTDP-4-dehydrorhamnose reductase [Ignavibacteriaceae bacterium]